MSEFTNSASDIVTTAVVCLGVGASGTGMYCTLENQYDFATRIKDAIHEKHGVEGVDRIEIPVADIGMLVDTKGKQQFYLISDPSVKVSIDQLIKALAADKGINPTHPALQEPSVVSPEKPQD